jgi:hypothetical protein
MGTKFFISGSILLKKLYGRFQFQVKNSLHRTVHNVFINVKYKPTITKFLVKTFPALPALVELFSRTVRRGYFAFSCLTLILSVSDYCIDIKLVAYFISISKLLTLARTK